MYQQIEPLAIKETLIVAATSTAQSVSIASRKFTIQNLDATETAYFKEYSKDEVACTATNGITLLKDTIYPFQHTAITLSILATGNCNVGITFLK